jgi:Carboxypeptidase regulatory-like domain
VPPEAGEADELPLAPKDRDGMMRGKSISRKTSTHRAFALLAALAVSLLLGMRGEAQSQVYGAVGGAVTDSQGGGVVDAVVSARNLATNAVASAKADSSGRYLIINLQPGNYELTVNVSSFSPYTQQVVAEVGVVTTADIVLGLAGQTQTVTVSGEAPTVDTEQSTFATNFNSVALENLPINARRWSYFALLTPGAVPDGTFGDISFRGVGYIFDNNTVDGTANTQAFFAEEVGRTRMAYSTSLNSVQEFQVTTSNYSAEYGRAVGGVVNAITKSGSNEIHGDVFYFNRDNTIGGAFTPFATGAVLQPSGLYASVPIKPLDIRQQMGGDAGGRIIKDRLFWYFNFDDQVHHFPVTNIPSTPNNFFLPITVAAPASCANATLSGSAAPKSLTTGQILECRGFTQAQVNSALAFLDSTTGTSPRTGDQTLFFPKLDWKPTDRDTITVSYNRARWTSPFGVQTGSVVARSIDSNGNDYVHDDRAIASWTTSIGTSLTNEARFSYSRDNEFEFTTPALPGEPVSSLTGLSPQVDINSCGFSGVTTETPTSVALPCGWIFGAPSYLQRPAFPNEQRYQVADNFGISKGRHLIKLGFDVSHVSDDLNSYASGDQLGEFSYTFLQDFMSDYITQANGLGGACTSTSAGTTFQIPCYNDYFQTFGPLAFNVSTVETAFFVQDDWHTTRRLTVNAGLRFDHEGLPSPVVPNPAIPQTVVFPSDHKEWAPRFGFAWDVFGNGKTVLRGGYGMFYGRITNEQIYEQLTLTGSPSGQINPTIFPTTGSANSTGTPTPSEPIYPNILPPSAFGVGKPNIVYFPADMRLPGAEEFDLVAEHQIAPNTLVSVSYIGSIGRFLPIGIDTNLPAATSLAYTVSGGPLNGRTVTEPFFAGARPNPNYQQMVMFCSCVTSHYNGLVGQFNRRISNGLQFNLSYTYASATDDGASSAAITSNTPVNPGDLSLEEGRSYLEVRHRFVGTVVWQPPYFAKSENAFARTALSGWTISLNEVAQSGLPYTAVISGNAPSGLGAAVSAGGPTGGKTSTRAVFVPKNGYTLPATVNTDMRIARSFPIYERLRLELTVEAFNLFNHVNYNSAVTTAYTTGGTAAAPTLTYSTGTSGFGALTAANNSVFIGARQLQFGAKFSF